MQLSMRTNCSFITFSYSTDCQVYADRDKIGGQWGSRAMGVRSIFLA
jgi:hypothetical protein